MADRPSLTGEWRASPWTIKAFAALTVLAFIGNGFVQGLDPWSVVGGFLINGLFIYGLIRGSRTAWVILLILEFFSVLSLIGIAAGRTVVEHAGSSLVINTLLRVMELFVLLHPVTRGWLKPQGTPSSSERLQAIAYGDKDPS